MSQPFKLYMTGDLVLDHPHGLERQSHAEAAGGESR